MHRGGRPVAELRRLLQGWLAVTMAVFLAVGCSAVRFDATWHATDVVAIKPEGQPVLALFFTHSATLRRRGEDAMAQQLTARGVRGVPGYTVLSDEELADRHAAQVKIEQLGYAGVVAMRVVNRSRRERWVGDPAWGRPVYGNFWSGYWTSAWTGVGPPWFEVETLSTLELLVYALPEDRLIWGGVSTAVEPIRLEQYIAGLAEAATQRMVKDGLLVQTPRR
jgi:hypothetical protein